MSFVPRALLAAFAMALAAPLPAADSPPPRTLSVSGQGEASGSPDLAEIDAGVQTSAATVVEASRENQAIVDRIFEALKAQGIAEKDIRTANYSVWPQQHWPQPGNTDHAPRVTGYQVSNMVHVKVRDIDAIGQVLAALTDAGANSINGIRFSVRNTDALEAEARRLAMEDARSRAESLARLAGVELGEVLAISMSGTPGYPPPYPAAARMEMADAGAPVPGISPGEQSITVTVHVSYAIR